MKRVVCLAVFVLSIGVAIGCNSDNPVAYNELDNELAIPAGAGIPKWGVPRIAVVCNHPVLDDEGPTVSMPSFQGSSAASCANQTVETPDPMANCNFTCKQYGGGGYYHIKCTSQNCGNYIFVFNELASCTEVYQINNSYEVTGYQCN